jgi:hypothetical protein
MLFNFPCYVDILQKGGNKDALGKLWVLWMGAWDLAGFL